MDATIIAAPSSTKNGTESRDPEMKQTKKGNNWHFGMKVHVGTDKRGVVHSLTVTHAARADITQMQTLVHGEERTIFGDQAYWKEADHQRFRAAGVRYRVSHSEERGPRVHVICVGELVPDAEVHRAASGDVSLLNGEFIHTHLIRLDKPKAGAFIHQRSTPFREDRTSTSIVSGCSELP